MAVICHKRGACNTVEGLIFGKCSPRDVFPQGEIPNPHCCLSLPLSRNTNGAGSANGEMRQSSFTAAADFSATQTAERLHKTTNVIITKFIPFYDTLLQTHKNHTNIQTHIPTSFIWFHLTYADFPRKHLHNAIFSQTISSGIRTISLGRRFGVSLPPSEALSRFRFGAESPARPKPHHSGLIFSLCVKRVIIWCSFRCGNIIYRLFSTLNNFFD